MKISLTNILSGFNLNKVNENFQKIQDEFNNRVMYRDNPLGEPNTINTDVDMNGNALYNLPAPVLPSQAARLQDVQDSLAGISRANLIPFDAYKAITSPTVQGAVQQVYELLYQRTISPIAYGAIGDGLADDTAAMVQAINALGNGDILDLGGKIYAMYNSLSGVTSGDAITIAALPRLYNKTGITVRNGTLKAANPSANATKVRFPSTFSLDGCSNIRFQGVRFIGKGENWGDSDASQPLSYELRRPWLAQNGGHACVVIRSKGVYFDDSCSFEGAGSTAAFYVSSSDDVVVNSGYASAKSLGYSAYAADAWCGQKAETGFDRARLYLNNCRSDNNGGSYGSKGCVSAEDRDTYVYVNGGVYKDAYANGSAHQLGMAFSSNGSHVYVNGAAVDNCASIGTTFNNITDDTCLHISNVTALNLRTSMHIFDRTSYGAHKIVYRNCYAEIVGTSLWSEAELSRSTVVANRKVSSEASIDIINCVTFGAHTFAINNSASYGGIRVVGGSHTVTDRIFDSLGWGGASANSGRGYELLAGVTFFVTSVSPSVAIAQSTTAMNAIQNQDASSVYTYQFVHFDKTASVTSASMREFMSIAALGTGLVDRRLLAANLFKCYQSNSPGVSRASSVRVVSLDGVAGALSKVTFAIEDNKAGNGMVLVDDLFANRRSQGIYAGPVVVGSEIQYGVYLNTATASLTVGTSYPVTYTG